MFRLQKKATTTSKKHDLHPGTWMSTVISAKSAPCYAKGHAQQICYELTDSAGNVYPYQEIFRTVEPVGQRSEDFFDYLADNGITEWDQFVGCQEVLTLEYEFKPSGRFLNITKRQFVYEDDEGESNVSGT